MDSGANQYGSDLAARIRKLEEAEAFDQRTLEQLNSELIELNRRMATVLTRLERLERRMERLPADLAPRSTEQSEDEAPSPLAGEAPVD